MSDFGVRKDVQQTHVIAVVVINVLLGSANNRPLNFEKKGNAPAPLTNETRLLPGLSSGVTLH